ncbi:glucose-1-phosphate thymidylyltransferase [Micromonospora thermarum]|uniref:Glucose-1-phosphate thymidylyltransferase n=1 Tax=Micromonospora thermarum TaxID=2720024 RepID=A0ABX0ZAX1_9ACTN|nr:glucose-1-phosphate thymidylyltransferase [Micromonospora thermarum]NJP33619.1 glucose-1-phosphate thymidylyltransferase [Micromonospora thermarum]
MKALVLAGGSGTRLRPLTYSMPKQLVPVGNRPVLEHVLDAVRAAGVTDVGVVVGGWAEQIADALGDGSRLGVRLTYLRQDQPRGLADCVRVARGFLGDDDFLMYLGDVMLPDGVARYADEFRALRPAAHVLVHKVADPRAFGVVELGPDGAVRRLVEKPREPRSDLALVGVYFFTSAVHAAVDAITPSGRGELEITDAVQWLVGAGADVRASEYHGYWRDTGRVEDLLACNRHLLDGLARDVAGQVDAASELTGPVVVAPGARVVASRVEGPVVIGADTVVQGCRIGPHTAIGRGCRLTDADVADSIVLEGASITAVRGLHGSLIGRSATVRPGPTAGSRLVVGDHTRVEIAA